MSTSIKAPETTPQPPPLPQKKMQTSTKWIIGIVVGLAILGFATILGLLAFLVPVTSDGGGNPEPVVEAPVGGEDPAPGAPVVGEDPDPVVEAPIEDGIWFAFITVGRDESGMVTLGVDLADMLTGQEAHDAAVDAGVITPDEDLPNDFFIKNEAAILERMHFSDDAEIRVISANDVSTHIDVTAEQLADLYNGTYVGGEVYGVAVGEPIPMDITIENGEIVSAVAVYLP